MKSRRIGLRTGLVAAGISAMLIGVMLALGAAAGPQATGPDTVMLKELVNLYEPVPFDHKSHAKMAQMWDGCTTCHHRNPEAAAPATQPAANNGVLQHPTKAAAASYPACKHCHAVEAPKAELRMPSLKGAYHRQCLNCHREWSGANDCVICHRPRGGGDAAKPPPTPDDIIGRMHPPNPAPQAKVYRARFTPADGSNVLFRHDEHVKSYGLKCVHCHRHDNCSNCHDSKAKHIEGHVLKPSETWQQSHDPCISCHTQTRCRGCHYKDNQAPPPPFTHSLTGQHLDADHAKLTCNQCHPALRSKAQLTCGGSSCHKRGEIIAYPKYRPGLYAATQPSTRPTTQASTPAHDPSHPEMSLETRW